MSSRSHYRPPAIPQSSDILAEQCLLWSSGELWQGFGVASYHIDNVETPKFQETNHRVVLHLSAPALVELEVDGTLDARTRVAGDLSIFPASTICKARSKHPHEILVVTLSQHLLEKSTAELRERPPVELLPSVYLRDAQLEHICLALKAEAESGYISGPLYGESLALALGARLCTQFAIVNSTARRRGGIAPRTMRRVTDYIEENLATPLTMATLAEIAGLSEYRFAHNFKSMVGLPPHQYVIHARLERAKRMLRETDLSILEIACASGCQSISRFNSLFRRAIGTTPSLYRASFR